MAKKNSLSSNWNDMLKNIIWTTNIFTDSESQQAGLSGSVKTLGSTIYWAHYCNLSILSRLMPYDTICGSLG